MFMQKYNNGVVSKIKEIWNTSRMNITIGMGACSSDSVPFALSIPRYVWNGENETTYRVVSIYNICILNQLTMYGSLFSRAHLAASIIPFTPRYPN